MTDWWNIPSAIIDKKYRSQKISKCSVHKIFIIILSTNIRGSGGTRWCSRLRHCATSRKVTGSIPDVVIGIFYRHNPFGCTMALRLTQPLTEMSTRNISWR